MAEGGLRLHFRVITIILLVFIGQFGSVGVLFHHSITSAYGRFRLHGQGFHGESELIFLSSRRVYVALM
jgi:hypothetical protein